MKPADAIWTAIIATSLISDVWLARQGHDLLTHRARTPVGVALQIALVVHFAGVWPGPDPFGLIGKVGRKNG